MALADAEFALATKKRPREAADMRRSTRSQGWSISPLEP